MKLQIKIVLYDQVISGLSVPPSALALVFCDNINLVSEALNDLI